MSSKPLTGWVRVNPPQIREARQEYDVLHYYEDGALKGRVTFMYYCYNAYAGHKRYGGLATERSAQNMVRKMLRPPPKLTGERSNAQRRYQPQATH